MAGEGTVEGSCPNAAERFGASANLPDCRAYELVTPQVKRDDSKLEDIFGFGDGDHVMFQSFLPLPGTTTGIEEMALSSRTESGWATMPLTPPPGPGPIYGGLEGKAEVFRDEASFTSDFSAAFINWQFNSSPLDQNGAPDTYRVDIPSGVASIESLPQSGPSTESLIDVPGVSYLGGAPGPGAYLAGSSADGSRVFFLTDAKLPTEPGTPVDTSSPSSVELYERHDGNTTLVGVMPDGEVPSCGADIGAGGQSPISNQSLYNYGVIAPDGSNVVFKVPGGEYGGECGAATRGVYLREDYNTKTVPLPGSSFAGRSGDGTKIFTLDEGHIYEYDVESGQATTITMDGGKIIAFAANGSRVYYLLEETLYVYDDGVTKTIPGAGAGYPPSSGLIELPLSTGADSAGKPDLGYTTPDGSEFAFIDTANLTSYNSGGHREVYLYNANTESITCVSCTPTGAPAQGDADFLRGQSFTLRQAGYNQHIPPTYDVISNDGSRVFFETTEALVPQDTNGLEDVYEWENGHIYLLSSGHGTVGSYIQGASENGNDVFIETTDQLLPQDIESSQQIYDARVDGGFPYTPPVYGCDSGQCQGPQTPAPVFGAPPSATFVGVGSPTFKEAPQTVAPKAAKKKAKPKKGRRKAKRSHTARGGRSRGIRHKHENKGRR
ncbi:MAG: hypothetical protein ACRDLF_06940 [Solirubrobacteraceae bacterium]